MSEVTDRQVAAAAVLEAMRQLHADASQAEDEVYVVAVGAAIAANQAIAEAAARR